MSAVTRKTDSAAPVIALLCAVAIALGVGSIWTIAAWLSGAGLAFVDPIAAIRDGNPWTGAHTAAAVLIGAIFLTVAVLAIVAAVRAAKNRTPADRAAPKMGTGRAIAPLLPAALRKRHARMGIPAEFVGLTVGYTVAGKVPVRASYEDTVTLIAGPRRNKSAAVVIPNVLAAPGTCLITSNKPDILTDTLGARSAAGTVSVFDPQRLASAHRGHDTWWNPLAKVRTTEHAAVLAAVFAAATYGAAGDNDPFFSQNGRTLMTDYLFAAALSGAYLPTVLDWLNQPTLPDPIDILEADYPHLAARVEAMQQLTERTRSGVYAYAREALSFLASDSIRAWVQPIAGAPEFDPETFVVAKADTLYLFSEEGPGSAGPLIAALTKAVLTAAENAAKAEPSGRMRVPFMAILDEAGNICRIPDLPDKYSHYGSRGIIVITILQSQEQGENVWGVTGFGQLWASSTVRVFGGGNASNAFYRDLSELIGDYEYHESSASTSNGQRTVTRSRRTERIMDVSDLAALTLGRMVVFASGCRPALVRSIPWWEDKALVKLNAAATASTQNTKAMEEHL